MTETLALYSTRMVGAAAAMKAASDEIGGQILGSSGRRAYRVGGWARALMMPEDTQDILNDADLTTGATPEQVQKAVPDAKLVTSIFPRFVAERYGQEIEIASFRGYRPGAPKVFPPPLLSDLPEDVAIKIDASRRDLTINSLYEAVDTGEIIDPQGGLEDIKRRVIRANGEPTERILEIKQRMIRALRFGCTYDFKIDLKLYQAIQGSSKMLFCAACVDTDYCHCRKHTGLRKEQLQFEAPEVVGENMVKILGGRSVSRALLMMRRTGILKHVLPEVHQVFANRKAGEALLSDVAATEGQGAATVISAMMRHAVGSDASAAKKIDRRLGRALSEAA